MIYINSKRNNLSVNLNDCIDINWSQFGYSQSSYKLYLYIEGDKNPIYSEEKNDKKPYTLIKFNKHLVGESRKKIIVKLYIIGKQESHIEETTFYTENELLGKASWITRLDNPIEKENEYFKDKPNIILKKEFQVKFIEDEMFLDICGLGYYDVYINNKRVNDFYLNSDVTNYDKVIYYDTYRIENLLKIGSNIIKVELANGWYNQGPINIIKKYNPRKQMAIGKPCLLAQISILTNNKQHILLESDDSWESSYGDYLFDNLYIGEKYSFRDIDLSKFDRLINLETVRIPGPKGSLKPSFIPKIKQTKKHIPTNISVTEDGILISFDQVITGFFGITVKTKLEKDIVIKYSEEITNSKLDFSSSSPGLIDKQLACQKDILLLKKGENKFLNNFTYHSFRYVFIEDKDFHNLELENIFAYSVHTDMDLSSKFKSSNVWLNELYDVAKRTKLNNIHSYYEDCPRERLGYGGDIVALINSQIYSFKSKELLKKVLNDFVSDQNLDGGITQTAPYIGIQTHGTSDRAGSLGWQYVLPVLVSYIYKNYGELITDTRVVTSLIKHLNYMMDFSFNYVKSCCIGDWGSIDSVLISNKETPPDKEFCSAIFYLLILKEYLALFKKFKKRLQIEINLNDIQNKINDTEKMIINEYYNNDGTFGERSQSSYVFALKAGLNVDNQDVYEKYIEKLKKDDCVLRSGIFGVSWTYEILNDKDNEIIYKWLNRKEYPSHYYSLQSGNNILPEYFSGEGSKNHAMFTSYTYWYYKKILGIDYYFEEKEQMKLKPYFCKDLSYAEGSYIAVSGMIYVMWERKDDSIKLTLELPNSIEYSILGKSKILNKEYNGNKIKLIINYPNN